MSDQQSSNNRNINRKMNVSAVDMIYCVSMALKSYDGQKLSESEEDMLFMFQNFYNFENDTNTSKDNIPEVTPVIEVDSVDMAYCAGIAIESRNNTSFDEETFDKLKSIHDKYDLDLYIESNTDKD